jgi:hypothetical protein
MRRAPTFSFIFFNDSIFERLQEVELKQQQEQEQQQPQHLKVQRRQEQERPNNSASVFVASGYHHGCSNAAAGVNTKRP